MFLLHMNIFYSFVSLYISRFSLPDTGYWVSI